VTVQFLETTLGHAEKSTESVDSISTFFSVVAETLSGSVTSRETEWSPFESKI
jgi:hypothetical protein